MDHPRTHLAPCKLYFGAHGGQFNELGNIRFEDRDDRLLCGRAYDCGHCTFLHHWLGEMQKQGFSPSWECITCIKFSKKFDDANGMQRILTGYYQAGRRRSEDSLQDDPDAPGLEGCLHVLESDNPETGQVAGQVCGWETSFLQLVLRRRDVRQFVPVSNT